MKKSFHAWRRAAAWTQAAVLIGLPFIRVHGESAFRFDVPSLRLYFFGSVIWISEAYFFLLVLLLFFVGIMLVTVLYGRIWCGWMCPQSALSEFARLFETLSKWITKSAARATVLSHLFILLFSIFVSADLIWYFVSPYQMIRDGAAGALGPWTLGSWIVFTALIYLDLAFIRQRFCGAVCPYARLQSSFFDDRTMTIVFDPTRKDECRNCEACVKACPAGIDIRKGLQVECINCAECIDSCARQMQKYGKGPLIDYFFGTDFKAVPKGTRPRVIGLAAVFGVIGMLFVYQIFVRIPVDFTVVPASDQQHHQVNYEGNLLNVYDFFMENRDLDPGEYRLSVSGVKDARLVIARNPFVITGNTALHARIYVLVARKDLIERVTPLRFVLENTKNRELRVIRVAPFVYPERTDWGVEI